MIIYVQHLTGLLQVSWYSREKAGFSLPYKVYGENSAKSVFHMLVSDLSDLLCMYTQKTACIRAVGL